MRLTLQGVAAKYHLTIWLNVAGRSQGVKQPPEYQSYLVYTLAGVLFGQSLKPIAAHRGAGRRVAYRLGLANRPPLEADLLTTSASRSTALAAASGVFSRTALRWRCKGLERSARVRRRKASHSGRRGAVGLEDAS